MAEDDVGKDASNSGGPGAIGHIVLLVSLVESQVMIRK